MADFRLKPLAEAILIGSMAVLTACGGSSSNSASTQDDVTAGVVTEDPTTEDPTTEDPTTEDPTTGEPAAEGTAAYVAQNDMLKGDFSEDVTLTAGTLYGIDGEVNFLEGATLTIPAGTTLYGVTGGSYLAINRGAKIIANGTAAEPIVFTSAQDVVGEAQANDQGQWGGLTILGQSTNNKGERTYEAGTQKYGPKDGVTIADDNSGELNYVIIKYSGFEIEADKELNGLSLGSVGSGTTIKNVAVIGSADDGIEFWGGTVNVENLYVLNAGDDSIDTDQGFTGTITNAFVRQIVVDDEIDSRAIEADGYNTTEAFDAAAPVDQQVISKPVLVNATLNTVGRAIRLREGTGFVFENVQVNVTESAFDPESTRYTEVDADGEFVENYVKDIAAIRISDDPTYDQAQIKTQGAGIGIRNEAVELDFSTDTAGDLGSDGVITSGKGIYRDSRTTDYFRALSDVNEVVGVADTLIDEEYLDSEGNVFVGEVAPNNQVEGVDETLFSWVTETTVEKKFDVLKGDYADDLELSADTIYAIDGEVNILDGAKITIPAGTTLYGSTGSSYLAVNRGAQIFAEGTASNPIVFTSAQDIAGQNSGDEQGQWGGLTILGQSTNNKGERTYEAGTQKYGPKDGVVIADDNSGILRYVVVKYSGFEIEKDKELNGISLGSVGSGTIVENIASIGSADDGIEFWGGTVSVNGLYVYNAGDDSLDTDQYYTGTMENVYVEQNVVDDEIDSRIIEADGLDSTTLDEPMSRPVLKDAILKGSGRLVRLREGTGYEFDNVQLIVESSTDVDAAAIRISDDNTFTLEGIKVAGEGLAIKNNANPAALYRDEATQNYFQSDAIGNTDLVLEDDNSTLTIPEYDRSWIPGWTK